MTHIPNKPMCPCHLCNPEAAILSGLEFCPKCGSGPRQQADTVECPDCGRRWDGPRLLDEQEQKQARLDEAAGPPDMSEAPACEQHGVMVADDERGDSWHCAACSAVWPQP